jgi:hypothetical protein
MTSLLYRTNQTGSINKDVMLVLSPRTDEAVILGKVYLLDPVFTLALKVKFTFPKAFLLLDIMD